MSNEPVHGFSDEFERAFNAHSGLIFRTAYRITGNASDAEDALQNVFLRFLRRAPGARTVDNEASYFRRAAVNAALDSVRARTPELGIPLDDLPAAPAQPEATGTREALRHALGKLKPRDAEIFALRFFEERSNAEIAQMLGLSRVLVAVIVHRTRKQLQNEIRPNQGVRS